MLAHNFSLRTYSHPVKLKGENRSLLLASPSISALSFSASCSHGKHLTSSRRLSSIRHLSSPRLLSASRASPSPRPSGRKPRSPSLTPAQIGPRRCPGRRIAEAHTDARLRSPPVRGPISAPAGPPQRCTGLEGARVGGACAVADRPSTLSSRPERSPRQWRP
jgi:hypothetical protein